MHKIYVKKIIEKNSKEDMECLEHIFDEAIEHIKECDKNLYDKLEMKLYEIANGKTLTDEMKMEWVKEMKPMAKWTYEEVEDLVRNYGIDIPVSSVYVIMNMLYSDMKVALGNGDDEESLKRYIDATECWYYDEDSKHTKEEKLFEYYFKVVK